MVALPTGTVTFLFTDIEGSTELLQRLGDRRYAEILAEHRRVLREAFAEGHGQEIDTQGDAFMVAFSRARDAVGRRWRRNGLSRSTPGLTARHCGSGWGSIRASVLEGSIERSANRVRVNAQLIDAETGYHLWAERFDHELDDLFTVRDEITERIAYTLRLQLISIEAQRAERERTTPEAMDYVMRGEGLALRPPSKDNYRQEQEMFERALQLDDRLPAAQTGLANTLAGKVLDGFSDAPEADLGRADDLVSKVLAVDSNDWRAHQVKAQILRAQAQVLGMQDRFKSAIAEYGTVIALDHNNAAAFSHLARCKIFIGAPDEAIPLLEQALRISPRDPSIGFVYHRLGLAHILLGHTDEAIQWYEKAIPSFSFKSMAYVELGAALSLKGDKGGGTGSTH